MKDKIIPTIAIVALALAPMFILAKDIGTDEFAKAGVGLLFAGTALGIRKISELWKSKGVDDPN